MNRILTEALSLKRLGKLVLPLFTGKDGYKSSVDTGEYLLTVQYEIFPIRHFDNFLITIIARNDVEYVIGGSTGNDYVVADKFVLPDSNIVQEYIRLLALQLVLMAHGHNKRFARCSFSNKSESIEFLKDVLNKECEFKPTTEIFSCETLQLNVWGV